VTRFAAVGNTKRRSRQKRQIILFTCHGREKKLPEKILS
jgi:hypothetical protein